MNFGYANDEVLEEMEQDLMVRMEANIRDPEIMGYHISQTTVMRGVQNSFTEPADGGADVEDSEMEDVDPPDIPDTIDLVSDSEPDGETIAGSDSDTDPDDEPLFDSDHTDDSAIESDETVEGSDTEYVFSSKLYWKTKYEASWRRHRPE